jgi:hypothetical protein
MLKRVLVIIGIVGIVGVTGIAVSAAVADEDSPTYLSPDEAGPDYAVQGEYVGQLDAGSGVGRWGAQVIALGDGQFTLVGYEGGLPGDGWKRGDRRERADGKTEGAVTRFVADDWTAEIRNQVLTVFDAHGPALGTLKRVNRESPTLGAQGPEGAIVLFDGSSAEHFDGGAMTPQGWLKAECSSKRALGDHKLHLEFRTPFKPFARGQDRGNSGVYVQSRYELQVLDSFGLEGENNECGGIYSIAKPAVNMCLPPLVWQTYDIDFTAARYENGQKVKNARVTIRHNGYIIMDDLELPHDTPGRLPEGPDPAPVYLQGHGNPVVFRNIWVVEK